jgi:hypothetical protein
MRQSFIKDIDAVGWVLRNPVDVYYPSFSVCPAFIHLTLDNSWG